jgi:lysophospholipase L1-like esterase
MNRRYFIASTAGTLGAISAAGIHTASAAEPKPVSPIKSNSTILFQGDSITDAGRSREQADQPNNQKALGNGYAWLAASKLLIDHPSDNLKVFNRGISGHKVPQLAERWQKDCIDLKPDVLSILIGVNDIWHKLNGNYEGTAASYERDYLALVERTLKALPDVKLIICEPFVLRCGAVKDNWFPEFDLYRASAKKVAETYHAAFVPFQTMFDEAVKLAPPEHWAQDGVHPSTSGASLMAHHWLKALDA